MKFSTVAIAATLAVVASAQLENFPTCGYTCYSGFTDGAGDCGANEYACMCSDPTFVRFASDCTDGMCEAADRQKTRAAAVSLCKSHGVDIKFPTPDTPQTTAAPATTLVPSAKPSENTPTGKGTIKSAIESQLPTSGSSRVANVAISVVGIGLLAAFSS